MGEVLALRTLACRARDFPLSTAAISGMVMQCAWRSGPFHAVVLVGAVYAVLASVRQHEPFRWFLSGLVWGATWHAMIPSGLLRWGPAVVFVAWLAPAVVCAIAFWVGARVRIVAIAPVRWLAFPLAWVVVTTLAARVGVPLTLTAQLALDTPTVLASSNVLGVGGVDGWVLATIALAIEYRFIPAITSAIALALLSAAPHDGTAKRFVPIVAIQPAIPYESFQAAGWSLASRRQIEMTLDDATARHIGSGSLVVWPESGNLLDNSRILRRRETLMSIAAGGVGGILVAGYEQKPDGTRHNSVVYVGPEGFGASARKTHLVPLAESKMSPGDPTVIATPVGRVGIAICFDSMFADHFEALLRAGADVVVVSSDASSFGRSALSRWHAAYTLARGIEAGTSVALLANRGWSVAADWTGRRLSEGSSPDAAVYKWHVPICGPPAQHPALLRHTIPWLAAVSLIGMLIAGRRGQTLPRDGRWRRDYAGASIIVVLATGIDPASTLLTEEHGLTAMRADLDDKLRQSTARDDYAIHFKQSTSRTCGAAAVAYLLTRMGDDVGESDLVKIRPPTSTGGYSMNDLKALAEARGFSARGVYGNESLLPSSASDRPVITHLSHGHYVVVLSTHGNNFVLFDPAFGQTLLVPREQFRQFWTGYALTLTARDWL